MKDEPTLLQVIWAQMRRSTEEGQTLSFRLIDLLGADGPSARSYVNNLIRSGYVTMLENDVMIEKRLFRLTRDTGPLHPIYVEGRDGNRPYMKDQNSDAHYPLAKRVEWESNEKSQMKRLLSENETVTYETFKELFKDDENPKGFKYTSLSYNIKRLIEEGFMVEVSTHKYQTQREGEAR